MVTMTLTQWTLLKPPNSPRKDRSVLARASADDTDDEHKDARKEPGDDLASPQGEPRNLDPQEEAEERRAGGSVAIAVLAAPAHGKIVPVARDGQDNHRNGEKDSDGNNVDEVAGND
ncbi:hypothetical protein HYQ46_011099 [Verticillium longisporum]|nr:hypothetical protein HYQ46_011099 [Verticillium longisporum]